MSLTECLAIDSERVQGYSRRKGNYEMLGRVTIVNEYEHKVFDRYVRPNGRVVDYRTPISGLTAQDMAYGDNFSDVRETVRQYIKGRIIVGHGIDHDLRALRLCHPRWNIRDTATYEPFIELNRNRTPSLRWLARRILGWNIQQGQHSSFEDARAAMRIYKKFESEWDAEYYETDSDESQEYYESDSSDSSY